VLHLDFSVVEPTGSLSEIRESFDLACNLKMNAMLGLSEEWFRGKISAASGESASANLQKILDYIIRNRLPPLYVIIDEYDNFANQLIVSHKDRLYYEMMSGGSFLKTFFKTLKEGRKTGAIGNVFVTGVLPITMDDLASGFNIATFLTLDPEFENMLGFTQSETDVLIDEIYQDHQMDPSSRSQVGELIQNQYDGYHFIRPHGKSLYNSTILMYFLDYFTRHYNIPEYLTDMNLKTDLAWVRRITGANPANTEEFVNRLTTENTIAYDKNFLISKFNMSQLFEKGFFPVSFFYLGMLTRQDDFFMRLPNLNMRKIFIEYFNEIHRIDVSTRYAEIMQRFVADMNLPALFAGYWDEYVSQLPEAVFCKVNENFYRTTFYELCSRYLSRWFVWNVERSYPKGRSDLEFVGKYHEKFAGIRMIIEFKYYSNTEFGKLGTTIADFRLQAEDTKQIAGYAEGLRQEYPEAIISQFVIYCFGNRGFRVFEVRDEE
jgi:hypothetical protein